MSLNSSPTRKKKTTTVSSVDHQTKRLWAMLGEEWAESPALFIVNYNFFFLFDPTHTVLC